MEDKLVNDDYDSPWKEALDEYFKDFLELLFPMVHDGINWDIAPQPRDKEFQKVTATAKLGRQIADKLKEVQTHEGETRWVLIHVEVQGQWEADFPRRIFRFDARLFDEFEKHIVSLVVLGDPNPDWVPKAFGWSFWGYEMGVRFPIVKLINLNIEGLEQSQNRFAPIVLAHLKTMTTKHEPQTRREWKFRIVRSLYEKGYAAEDVRKLFRLIDWFMYLPQDLEQGFQKDLEEYEEEHHMPYVTTIERMAEARGKAEGKAEGRVESKIEMILLTLKARFGEISPAVIKKIQTIQNDDLLNTHQLNAIMAQSLEDFVVKLETSVE